MNRAELCEKTKRRFERVFGHSPERVVFAPGRSNLIGEHTDYNDGHVLPVAIDRFTAAAVSNRSDRRVRFHTANLNQAFEFNLDKPPDSRPGWVSYMMGVIVEMEEEGYQLSGKEIAVFGTVPLGSGLSSSAALEVATATAIERIEGLDVEDDRLVSVCRRADHRFVGIKSGPMDQFASRACRAGHAGLLDCRTLKMTQHPLPVRIRLLSIYSGIPRALADSEYNERQASCQEAVRICRKIEPDVDALRDVSPEILQSAETRMEPRVFRRARHVVSEQTRVFALIEAMAATELNTIGQILLAGHRSLDEDYEVSLPLLNEMVERLQKEQGVVGTRLTGAGFGGSLICLIEENVCDVERTTERFKETFQGRTPEPVQIWELTTVDGAAFQADGEI